MTTEERLKQLRKEWVKYPQRREVILRRVKALKYAQKPVKVEDKFKQIVIDNLK